MFHSEGGLSMDQYNIYKEYSKIRDSYTMLKKQISIIRDEKKNVDEKIEQLNEAKVKEEIYIKKIEKEKSDLIEKVKGEWGIGSYILLWLILFFLSYNIIMKLYNFIFRNNLDGLIRWNGTVEKISFIIPFFLVIFIVKGFKKIDIKQNTRYKELIKEHKNSNNVLMRTKDELNKMIPYKESLEVKYEEKKRAIKGCEEQFLQLLSQV